MEGSGDVHEAAGGRLYKSRKARPCDACRKRKVTCVMPSGPPCKRCSGKALSCTFDQGPGQRKRPAVGLLPPVSQSPVGPVALSASSSPSLPPPSVSGHGPQVQPALAPMWLEDHGFFSAEQLSRSWGFQASFDVGNDGPSGADRTATDSGHLSLHALPGGRPVHHEGLIFPATPTFGLLDSPGRPRREEAGGFRELPQPLLSRPHQSLAFATPSPPVSRSPSADGPGLVEASLAGSGSIEPARRGPLATSGSLEILPGAFSFYIGPTGVSDIHLLSKGRFGFDGVTELSVKGLKYRRMQKGQRGRDPTSTKKGRRPENQARPSRSSGGDDTCSPPVIFGVTDHALLDKAEPKPDAEATESAWVALWKILTPQTAWSLIHLYARFVDPYFPILSRCQMPQEPDELSNMSLALLTAICATALPFVIHDRSLYALLLRPPSSEQLYRLCWQGVSQELHTPTMSTVQACLLLQQRLPTNLYLNDTAFSWSLMATAVSAAQTIGLHRDPSDWTTVPAWERRLRRRLWWALWATEKWVALARGMPSHLVDDEADVEPMRLDDINETLSDPETAQPHLYYLVSLTTILAEIQKTYYTVRATRQTLRNLALSLEVGRATRVRLKAWHDSLPAELQARNRQATTLSIQAMLADSNSGAGAGQHARAPAGSDWQKHLDGNASLHLSYIVTHMTLFRALLRPLEEDNSCHGRNGNNGSGRCSNCESHSCSSKPSGSVCSCREPGTQAVMRGALLCISEFVEFVEVLTPAQWNAFWHGWSRANFAIAGSFMVQLLQIVSAPTSPPGASKSNAAESPSSDNDVDAMSGVGSDADAGDLASAKTDTGPKPRPEFADEYRELAGWIRRWRWASRVSATGAAGAKGLTNLGLLRVETFIGQLGGMDDV